MHWIKCAYVNHPTHTHLKHGGGDPVGPPVVFCPLLKKYSGNPYLKILDYFQLFIADAPMSFFLNLVFPPRRALLRHPVQKYLKFFCFNKKNLLTNPSWNYILDIINFFLEFYDPPTNEMKKNKNFTYWEFGIKIG